LVKHALIVAPARTDELQSAARHASVHASSGIRFASTPPLWTRARLVPSASPLRPVRRAQGRANAACPWARSATCRRVQHREAPWRMQAEPAGLRRRAYSYCSKTAYDAHVSSSIRSRPPNQLPVPPPLLYSVRRHHHCRAATKPTPCSSQHHLTAPPLSLLLPELATTPPDRPAALPPACSV
jgi:hypothetical protein